MNELKELFDYQKFYSHPALSELIENVAEEYSLQEIGVSGQEISDDLDWLHAAGEEDNTDTNRYDNWTDKGDRGGL